METNGFSILPGPEAYELYYVPRLFDPWGRLLIDRLSLRPGEHLLDVATGPGTVARLAADKLGPDGRVVGIDISAEMLKVARQKPAVSGAPIEYIQAPAAPLPLPAAAFDAVTCLHAFQFFPDRPAALAEMRRVLLPGGRLGLACWRPLETCEHFAAIDHAIDDSDMPASWHEGIRAPFRGPSTEELTELLHEAGFVGIVIDSPTLPFRFEGGIQQAVDSLSVTPLAALLDAAPPEQTARFIEAFRHRLDGYRCSDGVVTKMSALVAVAGLTL